MSQTVLKQFPKRVPRDLSSEHDELLCRITNPNEHPVMYYVRSIPFESASYPANMYHGFPIGDPFGDKGEGHLMTWSPPAHDTERQRSRGCGFIRSPGSAGNEGLIHTACSEDKDHYARAKVNHCWSLTCPVCVNDTALRMGSRIEDQLMIYRVLTEKQGREPGPLGHWVISPPQDYAKGAVQTSEGFGRLRKHISEELRGIGASAGVLMFHPWRQTSYLWEFSPHFHSILFGFLDTDAFRERNPGWILKKVHANEEMESIGQTAAYIATHMGLGLTEKHPEEVDFDLKFLSYMLPGLTDDGGGSSGTHYVDGYAVDRNAFRYTDEDRELLLEGKGRMAGDLEGFDWVRWTMDQLYGRTRITYFGGASQKNIRTLTTEKEYRTRVCRQCGAPLNVYTGLCDEHGEQATYVFDNTVRTFRDDYDSVREVWEDVRDGLREEGTSIGKIAPRTALIASREETMTDGNKYRER